MDWPYQRLADALAGRPDDILASWLTSYRSSPLRLPTPFADDELSHWFAPLIESLTDALAPVPRADGRLGVPTGSLLAGAEDVREVEKAAAFLGGRLAAEKVSGFDVAAVFTALRDTLQPYCDADGQKEIVSFFEWLTVLAVDAMASARVSALQERTRDDLERGTPVVLVAPDVVATFMIGPPDPLALETTLGRVMLRVARVGASAVIVDLAGMSARDAQVHAAVGHFVEHRKIAGRVPVFLSGIEVDEIPAWTDTVARGQGTVALTSSFEDSLEKALEHSEYRLVRRR